MLTPVTPPVSAANPTASVGTAAVNGTATTFMRSDASPAIDVTMAPTWTGQHTFAAGTITTSKPLSITQTWNDGSITFNSLLVNVTATASAAASKLMDLQVASASAFSVDKNGDVTVGLAGGDFISNIGSGSNDLQFTGGSTKYVMNAAGFGLQSNKLIVWTDSTSSPINNRDIALSRSSANNVGFTNGSSTTYATIGAGGAIVTLASANALSIGPNGDTNPTLRVVTNVASAATGLSVTGNAAGSGVTLTALSSGSSENIILAPKQAATAGVVIVNGGLQILGVNTTGQFPTTGQGFELSFDTDGQAGSSSGGSGVSIFQSYARSGSAWRDVWFRGNNIQFDTNGNAALYFTAAGAAAFTPTARSSGVLPYHQIITPADTAQTASTEAIGVQFGGTNANPPVTVTRQYATGALTQHRENLFTAPTLAAVGASVITDAATVAISGAPVKGTNVTNTNTHGLLIQAGAVVGATNAYGLTVSSPTGGTTNYAGQFRSGSAGDGIVKLQHTSTGGYCDFEFSDPSGNQTMSCGYGNSATASPYASRNFWRINTKPLIFISGSTPIGYWETTGLLAIGNNTSPGAQLEVDASTAGTIAVIAKAAASRTAALLQLQTSAGASIGNVGGTVANDFVDINSASTDGTTEDILATYTSPANCLIINGDSIKETEHILTVASATATRRIKKYFGGSLIFDSGLLTLALGTDFTIWTTIIRESSTVVRCDVSVTTTSASTVPYSTYTRITGLTLTGTNVLVTKCLVGGAGAAAADVVEKLSKTWCSPAA